MKSADVFPPFTPYELDLTVPCKVCGANAQQPCEGQPAETVHFGRRLTRLLAGLRALDEQNGYRNRLEDGHE
jgi:hypothetical protein